MALDMGKGTKRTSGFGREVSGENNDHPSMRPQSPAKNKKIDHWNGVEKNEVELSQ